MKTKNLLRLVLFVTLSTSRGWALQAAEQAVLEQPAVGTDTLPERTALDDYVERQDDTFAWEIVNTSSADDVQTFVLTMNSQTWRTKDEVDRTVWQHWVTIAVPNKVQSEIGFMFIGGGGNGGSHRTVPIGESKELLVLLKQSLPRFI
jgi:PhoPQ-activated pathogenicity-related protein